MLGVKYSAAMGTFLCVQEVKENVPSKRVEQVKDRTLRDEAC